MQNKQLELKRIKTLNWTTLAIDFMAMAIFMVLLAIFFSSIAVPGHSTELEFPEATLPMSINVLGHLYSAGTVNFLITIFVIFTVISVTALVINVKHIRNLEHYDYHRWEAGNTIVQGFISLLTLNFVSFGLRIYTANKLMQYADDHTLVSFAKETLANYKEKRAIKKEDKKRELTDEEIAIKKKVNNQTILKVVRYSVTYLVLIIFAVFILIPFYWMILTSLKTFQQARATVPEIFVGFRDLQWVNIKFVMTDLQFGLYIKNTLIVALLSTLGTVVTTVFAAFAFSRIDFKGRETLFSILLMTMMIPGEIYMITNYITVSRQGFGWIGTGTGSTVGYFATMILPFMTSIFYIFFLRQTFKQVPDSLYKAAKVDGCSDFKFLRRVMIPIAGPTIFTITILSILGSWNAFIWPRLITSVEPAIGERFWLVSVALREESFVLDKGGGVAETMFNLQIAATAIVTVPLIIVFLALRKYIISGVGRSGTKG